ncbi:hypothetical protein HanIR_Chr16g0838271 [Helianthus annuus]|nr:hypothetical protein HanIR_Chr16g0838271 [Helianthus annuus]
MIHTQSLVTAVISRVCRFVKLLINSKAHNSSIPLSKIRLDNLRTLRQGKAAENLFLSPPSVNYK